MAPRRRPDPFACLIAAFRLPQSGLAAEAGKTICGGGIVTNAAPDT
jgi:hypothetical protein